jgi:hypothetical protein
MAARLKYHRETFHLLGRQPVRSPEAAAVLKQRERARKFKLPASVREWYSLAGAVETLEANSNSDHPVALERLGEPRGLWGPNSGEVFDGVADGVLHLMVANQGCCHWAVRLAPGDDPAVLVTEQLRPTGTVWRTVTEHFSQFVLSKVWGYGKSWLHAGGSLSAIADPLTPAARALLLTGCIHGPRTFDWPGGSHYNLMWIGAYIWVTDHAGHQSEWFLGADSPWVLESGARLVWHLATGLENPQGGFADEVLEALHDDPPAYPGPHWHLVFGVDLAAVFASGVRLYSPRDEAVPPPILDWLCERFTECHRRELSDGLTAHHFEGHGGQLFVVTDDYLADAAASTWWLHADTPDGLRGLARRLWDVGSLSKTLTGEGDAAGVLAEIRGGA